MNEPILDFGDVEDRSQNIIKVIGVGGGGCNAVRNMYEEGIEGVTLAVCNTDSQSLSKSPVPVKLQLGFEGLGAGAKPEVGRREAEANVEDIERLLDDGTKMDAYSASYYIISGHAPKHIEKSSRVWYRRLKVITLPRELVVFEGR